jgi:uroporphyrinogen-III synthase
MRLLVTRPEPDNAPTAEALRAQGHDVVLAPMLRIEMLPGVDLGAPPWSAILLSSANGARAIAAHPRRAELLSLPVLAVGRASAEAARAAGFAGVVSADGDATDLARLAAARLASAKSPVLYLAGEDRSGNLAGALSAQGIAVRTVAAYRAIRAEKFPADVHAALVRGEIGGVLHFSRRSAESYVDCGRDIPRQALAPVHYCLSARAAEPLKHAGAARILVAARPDEASLLASVAPNVMPKP